MQIFLSKGDALHLIMCFILVYARNLKFIHMYEQFLAKSEIGWFKFKCDKDILFSSCSQTHESQIKMTFYAD